MSENYNIKDFTSINDSEVFKKFEEALRLQNLAIHTKLARKFGIRYFDLKGDESLLEVGCGLGVASAMFADMLPNGFVTSFDYSDGMVNYCKEKHSRNNLSFQQANLFEFNSKETFDCVYVERVLHHVPNPEAAIKHIMTFVKPGGKLVFAEPDYKTFTLNAWDEKVTPLLIEKICADVENNRMARDLTEYLIKYNNLSNFETEVYVVPFYNEELLTVFPIEKHLKNLLEEKSVSQEEFDRFNTKLRTMMEKGLLHMAGHAVSIGIRVG